MMKYSHAVMGNRGFAQKQFSALPCDGRLINKKAGASGPRLSPLLLHYLSLLTRFIHDHFRCRFHRCEQVSRADHCSAHKL